MIDVDRSDLGGVSITAQTMFLVTAALLSDSLLGVPEQLGDLLAIVGVAALVGLIRASAPKAASVRAQRVDHALSVMVTLAAAGLLVFLRGSAEVFVFIMVLYSLDLIERRAGRSRAWFSVAEQSMLLWGSFLLAVDHVPWVASGIDRVAQMLSWVASLGVEGSVSVGAGLLGIDLVVLFIMYALVAARFSQDPRAVVRAMAFSAACFLAGTLHVVAWARLSMTSLMTFDGIGQPFVNDYDIRWFLFLLLLVLVWLYPLKPVQRPDAHLRGPYRSWIVVTLALVVAFFSVLVVWDGSAGDGSGNVLVLDSLAGANGQDVPVVDEYGLENAGMFGLLPGYLSGRGYGVRVVESLADDDLEWSDVLVIINLRESLDTSRKQAVWDFVESGGSLLLAGDHTGGEQIRDPSNTLLEPYGISLAFDSAIPLRDDWLNCLRVASHPIFDGISEQEIQVLIGASLSVDPPARVLLRGRGGYSDAGDLANVQEGSLGNMAYDAGERMGDVALVAEAFSGAGRVLVFGDTTTFQNPVLPRDYRFVDRVFHRLASDANATTWAIVDLAAVLVLVVVALGVVFMGRDDPRLVMSYAGAVVLVFTVAALPWWPSAVDDVEFVAPYAVVDLSHFEFGQVQKTPDSVDGLTLNLQRNGYTAFLMRDYDEALVRGADVLVVPSPLGSLTSQEISGIDDFVSGGGLLMVTAGSERPAGSRTLLGHFGLRLGLVPLGQATSLWNETPVHFWSAWPIESVSGRDMEVLTEVWGHPTAVYVPYGSGGVFAVGDASFLHNRNLEDIRNYNLHNIDFFREFLDSVGKGRGHDA